MVAECGTSSQETDVILASITSKEDSIAFIAADYKDESCEDENDGFHKKSIMIVRFKKEYKLISLLLIPLIRSIKNYFLKN